MQRTLRYSAIVMTAAALSLAGCGNSNMPGSSSRHAADQANAAASSQLLSLPQGKLTRDQAIQTMQAAMQDIAAAEGSMSVYQGMIAEHGTKAIKKQFAAIYKQYQACIKQAHAVTTKIASANPQALTKLVAAFNKNWKQVEQLVKQSNKLEMEAIAANPTTPQHAKK